MPEKKLNWGLLSTARINSALFGPLRTSKRNRLAAIASRTQDKADAFARQNKIPRAYGSYEALLADPGIDVIYNPLPNHLHAEWTIKAMAAGKHVLCEKPLALSVGEVDAIAAASKRYGRVAVEAFMYRTHAQTLKVEEMVRGGELGHIRLVRGSFTFLMTEPDDYRWKPEMGGGSLWDVGCYPLSYTRAVLGAEPQEVFGWQVTGQSGVDNSFFAQLRFPGDIYAQFDSSVTVPYRVFMEIIGDEGTLIVPTPFNPGLRESLFHMRQGKTKTIAVKGTDNYVSEVEDLADAVLLGRSTRVSLADSRANTAAISALFESARRGAPVKL